MKTGLNTKSHLQTVLPTILITVLVSAFATAIAMYPSAMPTAITILQPSNLAEYEIKVYADEECTTEMTQLDFGAIKAGTSTDEVTFYVKNTGTHTLTLNLKTSSSMDFNYEYANLNSAHTSDPLHPDDVAKLSIQLTIPANATVGTKEFHFFIQATTS